MAVQINLLPPEERQSLGALTGLIVLIILVAVAAATVFSYNLYTIYRLERELTVIQQQFSLLRPTQEKMLWANGQNQLVANKNAFLVNLTAERKSWYAILTRLGVVTPPQIWLIEVESSDKGALKIKGNALTYPDLAGFIQLLEQEEQVTAPQLIQAEQEPALGVIRFELSVKTKGSSHET
ncbi:PilN domain-containing protein [Sporomusa acidovorans]|uniref:Fimbrial assembly protein PilN n=1 Tax=Sporomusa acidovorans (strain ATCC 49682 / DSM 3132 / Mol) TaxID=1123286 RepID=A0ABZ3J199_SPOA4|nr:PilN domain-containing protein [Sporomusa acidovorans]OZC15029.1 fimbrial assembly protein PilN [Sporomusa acidovorans DSM 3132]SDE84337.1 Fimbrial assembly protein (PilN) [Sporomusa acidovorans]